MLKGRREEGDGMVPQRLEVLYGVMKGKRQKSLERERTDHAVGRHSSSEDLNELSGGKHFLGDEWKCVVVYNSWALGMLSH